MKSTDEEQTMTLAHYRPSYIKQSVTRQVKTKYFKFTTQLSNRSQRDHIIPRAEGGADTLENTALVHKTCHTKKMAMDREWARARRRNEKLEMNLRQCS